MKMFRYLYYNIFYEVKNNNNAHIQQGQMETLTNGPQGIMNRELKIK